MTKNVYTVGQVNAYIKNMFTQDFMMNRIYVKGEVSNCKYHTSGHIYFTLKDETGALNGVLFAGNRRGLAFSMKNGDNVIVLGSISVYERDGKYQLYAREILPDGEGLLYQRYQQLKQELEDMGMFAAEYKQPIPQYIHTLGIVTAPTGAAIRDIQNITRRRNPYVQPILFPALVQGEGAAESIASGIRALDQIGVDVIIVGRGGGSMEDLWAFNEETVADAVFACRTPVISAVGHETDFTITDFVADLRAPTPSAAAELAIYDVRQALELLYDYKDRLARSILRQVETSAERLGFLEDKLQGRHPEQQIREQRQRITNLEDRLTVLITQLCRERKHEFALLAGRLDSVSPLKKLQSGYAYVSDEEENMIDSAHGLKNGDRICVTFADGTVSAEVREITLSENGGK